MLAIAGALASLIGQFPLYVQGEYALINSGKANLVANFSVIGLLLIAGALLLFGSRAKHLSLIGLGMATVLGCVAFAGRFSDAALLLSSDQSAAGGWWISSFADLLTVVAGLVAVIALIAIGIRFRSGSMSPWVMLFGLLGLLIIIASNRLDRVDMVLHAPDGRTYSQAVGNLFSSFGWGDSGHVLTWVIAVSVVVMSALVLPRLVGIAALATVVVWMAVLDICTLAANAWGQQSLGYLGHPGYWATGSIRASFLLTVFGWLLMALAALLMFVSRWDVADAELASNSSSVSIGVASTMQ